ncbi:MAG: HNH endonuclease [Bacteroidota bacterium]
MNYSKKLKDPRWQKKRLKILERDNWTCQHCGDTETELQVHHWKYNGEPWEANDSDLATLCKDCHGSVESLKFLKKVDLQQCQVIKQILLEGSVVFIYMLPKGVLINTQLGSCYQFTYIIKDNIDQLIEHYQNG